MNVTGALRAYLLDNTEITALVGTRVYGPPGNSPTDPLRSEMASWGITPRKTIVLMASGGAGGGRGARTRMRWVENRIDVRCYGESPYQADVLHGEVYPAMIDLEGFTNGDTRLVSAEVSGGPLPARDGDADWPITLSVYIINAKFA